MLRRPPISTLFPYTTLFRSLLLPRVPVVSRRLVDNGIGRRAATAACREWIREREIRAVAAGGRRSRQVRREGGPDSEGRVKRHLERSQLRSDEVVKHPVTAAEDGLVAAERAPCKSKSGPPVGLVRDVVIPGPTGLLRGLKRIDRQQIGVSRARSYGCWRVLQQDQLGIRKVERS